MRSPDQARGVARLIVCNATTTIKIIIVATNSTMLDCMITPQNIEYAEVLPLYFGRLF